jgi:pimeloyl-ACP methyl ester carboxylesterase
MEPQLERVRTADGVSIAWTSSGTGPALVHLPGVPFSNFVEEWRIPVLQRAFGGLAQAHRLVQYDGRGTGRSQRDVEDVSLDGLVRDLEAVVDAAGLDRFAVLGFYHSVTVAIAYAARHPDRVSHLVLYGGGARGWSPMAGPGTQALLSLIEQDWDTFVESIAHAWLGWGVDEVQGRLAADWFRHATSAANARVTLREASAIDVTPLLALVSPPALVLHRRDATVISMPVSEDLVAGLPNARLEVLEGRSASLFFEDTDTVVETIVAFIEDRPPAFAPSRRPGLAPVGLSPRELEVLRLVAAGDSNGEIAARLGLSIHTVERHVANLYRKIDARGRADATAYAIRSGLAT